MLCPNCGSSITGLGNKCTRCGKHIEGQSSNKKRSIWPALLILSAAGLVLFFGLNHMREEDSSKTVKDQLKAIREDHLTDAYYGYTSQEFQKAVSLEAFRDFVKNYPALLKNKSLTVDTVKEDNGFKNIKGDLYYDDHSKVGVEYHLIKENNDWKIVNLQFHNLIADTATVDAPKADSRELEELVIPVNLQLKALQQKDYEKSYQGLMTKDFEKNTPFDVYKRFIESYPILTEYKTFAIQEKNIEQDQGKILVVLKGDKDANLPVEYHLIRDGDQWKIWSMRLVLPETDESNENAKILKGVIQAQIESIEKGRFSDAYKLYTSKDFQTATSEEQFLNMAKNFAAFQDKNIVDVSVDQVTNSGKVIILNGFLLTKDDRKYPFEYDFVNEEGQWKIVYMTITNPIQTATVAKPAADRSKMTFAQMDIGTAVDLNAKITNPSTVLNIKDGEIYANLHVHDALKGDKVEVILNHLDSNSKVPPVSTAVSQDGDSVLSFVFSPPGQGWPKGSYQIDVSSASTASKSYNFKIE